MKITLNKRGISPLIATVLLVAFAVALGAVVMSWTSGVEPEPAIGGTCIISTVPSDPMQQLMISYIKGDISKQEYLAREKQFI